MPKQKIIKRNDGRYRVKYKGIQFYGHSPSEATAKRDEYKKQELLGLKFRSKDILFSDYSAKWLNIYKSNSSVKTYNRYAYIINRMIDFFQNKKVKEILSTDIKEYYNTLDVQLFALKGNNYARKY